ncbi:hypothetical protein ADUPG1_012339 [Aduncisulcus paluster]|uniref:Uncharacterized protein n=1 Tax=Aduncisulcus paluster TaxID=2918883 RepID=A0ABQ5K3W8_9EUKA|nr:hypothetical protein ADUPG1_012339 [Aduncisulcus paluster]
MAIVYHSINSLVFLQTSNITRVTRTFCCSLRDIHPFVRGIVNGVPERVSKIMSTATQLLSCVVANIATGGDHVHCNLSTVYTAKTLLAASDVICRGRSKRLRKTPALYKLIHRVWTDCHHPMLYGYDKGVSQALSEYAKQWSNHVPYGGRLLEKDMKHDSIAVIHCMSSRPKVSPD